MTTASGLLRSWLTDPSAVEFIADNSLYATPARAITTYRRLFEFAPELTVSAAAAGLTSLLAKFAAAIAVTRRMKTDNGRMRVAINNMSQGLCMFDVDERLVVWIAAT